MHWKRGEYHLCEVNPMLCTENVSVGHHVLMLVVPGVLFTFKWKLVCEVWHASAHYCTMTNEPAIVNSVIDSTWEWNFSTHIIGDNGVDGPILPNTVLTMWHCSCEWVLQIWSEIEVNHEKTAFLGKINNTRYWHIKCNIVAMTGATWCPFKQIPPFSIPIHITP